MRHMPFAEKFRAVPLAGEDRLAAVGREGGAAGRRTSPMVLSAARGDFREPPHHRARGEDDGKSDVKQAEYDRQNERAKPVCRNLLHAS